jgi:hypothetical protein
VQLLLAGLAYLGIIARAPFTQPIIARTQSQQCRARI